MAPMARFRGDDAHVPLPMVKEYYEFELAYLHLVESRISGDAGVQSAEDLGFLVHAYGDVSPIVIAGGYKADSAKQAVDLQYKNHEVIIALGRPFTSNPDLPFRIMGSMDLRPHDRDVFYLHQDRRGYIDYDYSEEFKATFEPRTQC